MQSDESEDQQGQLPARLVATIDGLSMTDVVIEAEIEGYQRELEFFHQALLDLNINLYIADRVLKFPIDALTEHINDKKIFLGQVVDNFLDASVLIVTKLTTDTDSDFHTLVQLKNQLMRISKPDYRDGVKQRLKLAKFDHATKQLLARAKLLRDSRIAHFKPDYVLGLLGPEVVGQLGEIKKLRDELNHLLSALYFDVEAIMLPLSYEDGEADIDEFLDAIARSSIVLNLPESDPQYWEHVRGRMSQEDVVAINYYRVKFNMPPA